ncbi:hypothetical protein OSTOST_10605 [Ostertagia ostertagi]
MSFSNNYFQESKVVSSKSSSLKEQAKSLADKKKLRRGKRQVLFEDAISPNDDEDEFTEEDAIRQQLQQLSDDELAALADIVREEMIRYDQPQQMVAMPQYEIIEIPDEMLGDQVLEPFPRDRRAMIPIDWELPTMDEPQYIPLPDEAVIEALNDERDEEELRERIAEIAQILNERATRRSRLF